MLMICSVNKYNKLLNIQKKVEYAQIYAFALNTRPRSFQDYNIIN